METITIGGKTYQVSKDVKDAIDAELAAQGKTLADVQVQVKTAQDSLTAVKTEKDQLQARFDSAQEELSKRMDKADAQPTLEQINTAAKARLRVLDAALKVLPKETNLDSLDDLAIKREVIKVKAPKCSLEGKTDAYVEARFDSIVETLAGQDASARAISDAVNGTRQTSATTGNMDAADEARAKARKEAEESWKQPVGVHKKK